MGYYVDRVVICDAYREPDKHYQILPGGKSKLAAGRRPSMRFVAGGRDARGGIRAIVAKKRISLPSREPARTAERLRQPTS